MRRVAMPGGHDPRGEDTGAEPPGGRAGDTAIEEQPQVVETAAVEGFPAPVFAEDASGPGVLVVK